MTTELNALLRKVSFTPGTDRLVSVGDLVHKGPDSAGTVRLMREAEAILVMGNHEDQQARFRAALAAAPDPSKIKMKNTEELLAVENGLAPEDVAFLESAVPFLRLPEHDALVVHGGVLPVQESLPTQDELAGMSKGERKKLHMMCRTRHVTGKLQAKVEVEFSGLDFEPSFNRGEGLTPEDVEKLLEAMSIVVTKKQVRPAGSFISLGQEAKDDPFWADVYGIDERGPRFGHIYFGHSPFIGGEPARFPHATGLDTGAVFGGSLTAAVLTLGQDPYFVSVLSSGKYATSRWED